jgi:hypothetical protein
VVLLSTVAEIPNTVVSQSCVQDVLASFGEIKSERRRWAEARKDYAKALEAKSDPIHSIIG